VDGVVTSTSLMVDAPAAATASALAARHPALSVGLHFVDSASCDLDHPPAARAEIERQLERFRMLVGADPTHLDSHHHVHLEGDRLVVFAGAARTLGVPVRGGGAVRYVGDFYGQGDHGANDLTRVSPEHLDWLLINEVDTGATEISCHPAAGLEGLRSSYATERMVELRTLTEPGLRRRVAAQGIRLVGYRDLNG